MKEFSSMEPICKRCSKAVSRRWRFAACHLLQVFTLLVKLTFLLKTNMEVDSEDATSQSLLNTEAETSQSLLNTEYDQLIGGEDANSSDSEDYGLTSYQQPPPQEPLRGKNEAKKKNLKRKASEVPTTTCLDTTDFIHFIENTKVKKRTFLVSMDVTSLYTNTPQNEGILFLFLHITCGKC